MSLDVTLLRDSFDLVVERNPQVVTRFYEILFDRYPQVRPLFGQRNASQVQEAMLTQALVAVMDHIEDASWLRETLEGLGAKHVTYGVEDEMYAWVGECLVAAMAEAAGDAWNDELSAEWTGAWGAIAGMCLDGAAHARAGGSVGA